MSKPSSAVTDYFALLNLPPAFDIDVQVLETAYFKAQRQWHPDRFTGKPPAERQQALQHSVDINNAYNTLKAPLSRAQYLLKAQGISIGAEEGDKIKPTADLLAEVMEWRELVAEAETPQVVETLAHKMTQQERDTTEDISAAYDKKDWQAMAKHVLRLSYIMKTHDEIALQRHRLKKTHAT